MTGFGNHFATEAVAGALPIGRNSPQKPPFGLYTEQLSGTAFTAPRHENRAPGSTACARRRTPRLCAAIPARAFRARPQQGSARAQPPALGPADIEDADWLDSLTTMIVAGDGPRLRPASPCISMPRRRTWSTALFSAADGELLILPEMGALTLAHRTRPDRREARPGRADPARRTLPRRRSPTARRAAMSRESREPVPLPDLGPIGSNGLANPRDLP
jgi:homogentisate 1,2-dioxygenase